MRSLRHLPDSRFRGIAIGVLAAVAVGTTAFGLGPGSESTDPPPSSTAPTTTAATTTTTVEPEGDTETTDRTETGAPRSTLDPAVALSDDTTPEQGAVTAEPVPTSPPATQPDAQASAAPEDADGDATLCPVETQPAQSASDERDPDPLPETGAVDEGGDSGAAPDGTDPADRGDVVFADGFDRDQGWTPLSGSWALLDGRYVQQDATGYDFITQVPVDTPPEYAVSVDMTATGEGLGGGVVVGQPVVGSRRGATLVDFTDGGRFIRWGRYDEESGQYRYLGGVATNDGFDITATHRLTVDARADRTLVVLDGVAVGEFDPVGPGRVGLATSLSSVAFDDLEVLGL